MNEPMLRLDGQVRRFTDFDRPAKAAKATIPNPVPVGPLIPARG